MDCLSLVLAPVVIHWTIPLIHLTAVSQLADSGNRLAAIVSTAGISPPLQIQRISSGMPISAIINSGKQIAATDHRTGFQQEMGKNYQL